MKNLLSCPAVLVARGCLAPYFLGWWQAQTTPLFVLDFSRWRWFEFGQLAEPRWIGPKPPNGHVVLFDRNTTTGQTLRLLKKWLEADGYKVVVVGHMDLKMGRFGLRYLDYVWDDSEGYDRLGLACQGKKVNIVPVQDFNKNLAGAYTFCVLGGERPELGGTNAPESAVDLRSQPVANKGSVIFQSVPSWEQAMILGYINQKPLITIAGRDGIVADYGWTTDLTEIINYLKEESR